jgi:hypothetical protein
MRSRQLESTVLACVAIVITFVFASLVRSADHPTVAAGIGLQTLAGLFAAVQLWGNNASDALVRWAARQIDSNSWHIGGLFDGRFCSPLIAAAWLLSAYGVDRLFRMWSPCEIVGWPIAILILVNFVVALLVLVLSLFMYTGARLVGGAELLPDGEPVTALRARLAANNWIWPIVALTFLGGGVLQIIAV